MTLVTLEVFGSFEDTILICVAAGTLFYIAVKYFSGSTVEREDPLKNYQITVDNTEGSYVQSIVY